MKCEKCGFENSPNSKFCNDCGSALSTKKSCPDCNHENPIGAKFCSECSHRFNITSDSSKSRSNFDDTSELNKVKRKIAIEFLDRGRESFKNKEYLDSIKSFEVAIEKASGIGDYDTLKKACGNKGAALFALERYSEALPYFEKVIGMDPNDVKAWINKGGALGYLGRMSEALTCYEKAIEIDPNNAVAWHSKGFVLDQLERYSEALTCYEKAIGIDPNNASTWYLKGFTLGYLGRVVPEAKECYEKALQIDPNLNEARELLEAINEDIAHNEDNDKTRGFLDSMAKSTIKVADAVARTTLTIGEIALDNYLESQNQESKYEEDVGQYDPPYPGPPSHSSNSSQEDIPKSLRKMLSPGERVIYSTQQSRFKSGGNIANPTELYLTTNRIIWIDPKLMGLRKDYDQILYNNIIKIYPEQGILSSDLIVVTAHSGTRVIYAIPKGDAKEICGIVSQLILDFEYGYKNVRHNYHHFR